MARRGGYRAPRFPWRSRGQSSFLETRRLPPPVNGYSISITSPVSGTTTSDNTPSITVLPVAELGGPCDIQVEWRTTQPFLSGTTWTPTATYTQSLPGNPSGVPVVVTAPTTLAYTTWYFRVRAGSVASGNWSAWTAPAYQINVQPVLGSIAGYLDMNVGVSAPLVRNAIAYMDMNVGVEPLDLLDSVVAVTDMNIGIQTHWLLTARYADLNISPQLGAYKVARYADLNVVTGRPSPHIWWIRPEQGREGYVFHIFGHGFGQFENQYDGEVRLGALICPVLTWEIVDDSAGASPHSIVHGEGLDPDFINTEYGHIVVLVPSGAVSAMVKVVLEGDG